MARLLIKAALVGWLVAVAGASACGSNLGECDAPAAQELVFSDNGLVATKGQALAHDSCANGAFCHSAAAHGDARYGAPADMNFDVLPAPTGWPALMERREQAWSLVVSDHMPPGKAGEQVRGDGAWVFDARRRADAARLPALASDEGKSAFRNWLACGAPLVSQPKVPAWVQQTAAGGSDDDAGTGSDFGAIFGHILQPNCASAGCHNASAAGSLKMLDACGAYAELMRAGACGMPRVRPGDPGSLLLSKIESRTPICGGAMPPTGPLAADKIAVLRDWISSGAPAPSCP